MHIWGDADLYDLLSEARNNQCNFDAIRDVKNAVRKLYMSL